MPPITALASMTPEQVRSALTRFRPTYVTDWDRWIDARPAERAEVFGDVLRRWQATRPNPMRRTRADGRHPPPHLDDLLDRAAVCVETIRRLGLSWVNLRSTQQTRAFHDLWAIFADLALTGTASSVGISKAVMLVTDGRIGPALDSQVRGRLGIRPPLDAEQWLDILEGVASDIRAFERQHGTLRRVVQPEYQNLEDGRLYDMIFGPGGE
jgi:hypothetical protein